VMTERLLPESVSVTAVGSRATCERWALWWLGMQTRGWPVERDALRVRVEDHEVDPHDFYLVVTVPPMVGPLMNYAGGEYRVWCMVP
jgi:hypothetical protein